MTGVACAVTQAAHVRSGEVTARELVEASLRSIERLDGELNAFVARCPERALAEADAVRPGDPRPLCGVPVALKDLFTATEGLPTTEGSRAFGDWVASHDAAHVRRLRAAGAIVVGKTASPELGLRPVTESERHGITRNPWDLRLTPGGSSGGSAAAVASGMVALADGSDLGGSIRIPASCCGVVGFRPSRGRVSFAPDAGDPALGRMAHGPLARSVADAAAALDVLAGNEPGDHHVGVPVDGSFAAAAATPPGRLHVRFTTQAPHGVPVDPEPAAAARRAADVLARLGHDVEEAAPDWDDEDLPEAWATFMTGIGQHLLRAVAAAHGGRFDPDALEPATRRWLVDVPPVTAAEHLEAAERLVAVTRRIVAGWGDDHVLATPTLTRLPGEAGRLISKPGVSDDALRYSAFARICNITGQPAISLPLGEAAGGVPVGVQLIGPPGRDDVVLAAAAQLEQAAGYLPLRPPAVAAGAV